MSKAVRKIISDAMAFLKLEYGFGEYKGNKDGQIVYPYFVGEYQENEPINEDGLQESLFMLTGFSRDKWATLEDAKDSIESYFDRVSGKIVMVEDGSAVAIFYASSMIVPTGDAELKRIQINLTVKEWKVT